MVMTAKETNVITRFAKIIEGFVDSAVNEKFALPELLEGVLLLIAKGESRVITLLLRESPELGKQVKKDFQNLRQLLDAELHANLSDGSDKDDFVLDLTFTRIVNNVKQLARRLRDAVSDGIEQNAAPAKRRGIKRIPGWIFEKTSHLIGAIIVATIGSIIAAILIDILADFGWIQSIKGFIYHIFRPK
ncbi:MAG: hypothetical protein JW749_01215 [Sedimentisphaerales bacterium]|nr:hypothetical protein [Sedimentisphaerales bacterium]